MTTTTAPVVLDRRGKTITTFVGCDGAAALRELPEGYQLQLVTDDFEPLRRDLAAWCEAVGHRLVSCEPVPEGLRFLIEKGTPKAAEGSLAVVISSDGLEQLLSPLGFALAAALDGMGVDIYGQGPAVRVLKRDFRPKLRWLEMALQSFRGGRAEPSGPRASPSEARAAPRPGSRDLRVRPSMQHFRVKPDDMVFTNLPVVEYFSFMAAIQRANVHIYA